MSEANSSANVARKCILQYKFTLPLPTREIQSIFNRLTRSILKKLPEGKFVCDFLSSVSWEIMYFYSIVTLIFVGNGLLSSATHTTIHELCEDKCGYDCHKVTAIPDCYAGKITCLCWSDCHNYNVTVTSAPNVYQMSDGKVCYHGCEAGGPVVISERRNGNTYPCVSLLIDPYTGKVVGRNRCIRDGQRCQVDGGFGTCNNNGVCEIRPDSDTSTADAQAEAQEIFVVDIEEADGRIQQLCEKECGHHSCRVTVETNCRSGEITCRCWRDFHKYTEKSTYAPDVYQMSDGRVCYHRTAVRSVILIADRHRGTCERNPWAQLVIVPAGQRVDRKIACF